MRQRPPVPPGPYLVVGLARSGTAAALALRERGEEVLGLDSGTPANLTRLAEAGVKLYPGEQGTELLEHVRTVIKSPGVPRQAPVLRAAVEQGLPVLGELELAWRLLSNEFLAVTGTNGKTTTVELVGHMHRQAGLQVAVAGNVGAAVSGLIGRADPALTVVCEVSSFQLEDALAFAPEAAVLLNIAPDHLDRHETLDAYTAAKLAVFAHQGEDDLAIAPLELDLPGILAGGAGRGGGRAWPGGGRARRAYFARERNPEAVMYESERSLWWRGEPFIEVGELALRGAHNVENAMAAALLCLERGMEPEAVKGALRTFPGVAHRLEALATVGGVAYVNDSKSTNVASTLVALQRFAEEAMVHLILGGQGKGQDFRPLREPVAAGCRAVYLIGEDAPLIAAELEGGQVPVHRCEQLERALSAASAAARPGEVVLLSPGCASFDQFSDYEARGERFRRLVAAL